MDHNAPTDGAVTLAEEPVNQGRRPLQHRHRHLKHNPSHPTPSQRRFRREMGGKQTTPSPSPTPFPLPSVPPFSGSRRSKG